MTPAEVLCAQLLTAGCEATFLAGAAWVWRALTRLHVNGPCQLGIALLVLLRVSVVADVMAAGGGSLLDYTWLTETLFSFVFLYTLYHMGVLIASRRSTERG